MSLFFYRIQNCILAKKKRLCFTSFSVTQVFEEDKVPREIRTPNTRENIFMGKLCKELEVQSRGETS